MPAWRALPVSPAEAAWLLTGRVVRPRDTRPRRGRVGGGIEPNLPQPDDTRPRQTNLFSPQASRFGLTVSPEVELLEVRPI